MSYSLKPKVMNDFILGTSNYNTIQALCDEALTKSKMIGVVGYSGAGKTTALEAYSNGRSNVYYVRVTKSMNAKQFHSSILNEMGVEGKDFGTSLYDLINNIAYRLNYNGLNKLLIIDEAGKFKASFLEYLHELRDKTLDTTGIIIAGPEYFKKNLIKWKGRGVIGIPEFYRRVNYWEELDPPSKTEVRGFCNQCGIEDEDFVSELTKVCENFSDILNGIEIYLQKRDQIEIITNV